jgi:hypothetical protein
MVAKHFENSEWGFLFKKKRRETIKCLNVLHKNFIGRKLNTFRMEVLAAFAII